MEDRKPVEEPAECPDCGALFKSEARLGTHQFKAHGKDRRTVEGDDKTRAPGTPQPKPKDKEPAKQSSDKPSGDSTDAPKRPRSRWFGDR